MLPLQCMLCCDRDLLQYLAYVALLVLVTSHSMFCQLQLNPSFFALIPYIFLLQCLHSSHSDGFPRTFDSHKCLPSCHRFSLFVTSPAQVSFTIKATTTSADKVSRFGWEGPLTQRL
jgi:hypothetical protein